MASKALKKLTEYEKKYVDIVGRRFGVHGRSEAMGQIFALLNLKAKTPEAAMNQQDIATLIRKSISTVSRSLKKLVQGGYCDYVLEDNEQDRAERRYHAKRDYTELLLARISHTLAEAQGMVDDLTSLSQSISEGKKKENKQLIDQIQLYVEQTRIASRAVEKLGDDILKGLGKQGHG
ncbi:MAG: hypothetical protein JSW61_06185 [Candidatus Thorarchaeota archaeon]|nr:MAG: hypothetical protein JSW61_06185 [Candidatus Thorarchaeota archaeon]